MMFKLRPGKDTLRQFSKSNTKVISTRLHTKAGWFAAMFAKFSRRYLKTTHSPSSKQFSHRVKSTLED